MSEIEISDFDREPRSALDVVRDSEHNEHDCCQGAGNRYDYNRELGFPRDCEIKIKIVQNICWTRIRILEEETLAFVDIYRQRRYLFADVVGEDHDDRVHVWLQEVMDYRKAARFELLAIVASLVSGYVVLSRVQQEAFVERSRTLAANVQREHLPRLDPVRTFHSQVRDGRCKK